MTKILVKNNPLNDIISESSGKRILEFKKNEYLFHEGDPAGGIYLILSGKIKIVKDDNLPAQMILFLAKPGDVLGIHAVINEQGYTNSAVALVNASACFVPAQDFKDLINNNNQYKLSVMQLLCTNIDLLENKISSRSEKNASERFAELLLLLAETYGMTDKHNLKIELSAEDLANLAGTSKVYLGKIIGEFCRKEWIYVKGNTIKILDRKSLEKEAKL